jgi:HK97 family phage prohead protease
MLVKAIAVLSGYACVFGEPTMRDDDGTRRRVLFGAFKKALRRDAAVPLVINHDETRVVCTTANGLRLWQDDGGLRFEATIPDTAIGREVVTAHEGGGLHGMSFRVDTRRTTYEWGKNRRTAWLVSTEGLLHVSVITGESWPAVARTKGLLKLVKAARAVPCYPVPY